MSTTHHGRIVGESGMALVVVLWLVALLSLMAVSQASMQRTEIKVTGNLEESAKARAAAQGGIQIAIMELIKAPSARQLRLDGSIYETQFSDATLWITVVDEAGKIDLNFASGPLIDVLLSGAGVEDELERAQLTDAILDWRDSDQLRRMHGAEQDEYTTAGLEYGPRNGPFQSVEELALVLGISTRLYHALSDSVTIYSGARSVSEPITARLSAQQMKSMNDVVEWPADDEALTVSEDNSQSLNRAVTHERVVTIRCEARLPGGAREILEATVRLTPRRGNARHLYEILVWREAIAGVAPGTASPQI